MSLLAVACSLKIKARRSNHPTLSAMMLIPGSTAFPTLSCMSNTVYLRACLGQCACPKAGHTWVISMSFTPALGCSTWPTCTLHGWSA